MPELCCDILQNILNRLPAKNLIELKSVCKSWKHIIEDPLFVKSHTKHHQSAAAASILIRNNNGGKLYSLPINRLHYPNPNPNPKPYPDPADLIQMIPLKQLIRRGLPLLAELPAPSCNGLILISHENINKSWAIWNPLTQDSHQVPPPLSEKRGGPRLINFFKGIMSDRRIESASFSIKIGFGYDEDSDDYKVVWAGGVRYGNKANSYHERAMIYSLKLRYWRVLKSFPDSSDYRGVGAFLNGGLHWKSRREDKIFVFHLGREDHHFVAAPPRPPPTTPYTDRLWHWDDLDALDGCLIMSYKDSIKRSLDVWVMKDYESKVWTKLFSVVQFDVVHMRVVSYLKSKGQVIWKDGNSCLKWRDLETKCEKEITITISISIPGDGVRPFALCFGQLSPGSLVRLDGTNNTRVGVKRKSKTEKKDIAYAYTWPRPTKY